MQTLGLTGIASIECPTCGRAFSDYDAPVPWKGILRVTARCRHCRTEELLEIDQGQHETSVRGISRTPWVETG